LRETGPQLHRRLKQRQLEHGVRQESAQTARDLNDHIRDCMSRSQLSAQCLNERDRRIKVRAAYGTQERDERRKQRHRKIAARESFSHDSGASLAASYIERLDRQAREEFDLSFKLFKCLAEGERLLGISTFNRRGVFDTPGAANSSQLLLRKPSAGRFMRLRRSSARGCTWPLGKLPALEAWNLP
jgi:hypothetical protein